MHAPHLTLAVRVVPVSSALPDADTDVLIFDGSSPEAQLGAYVGHGIDGAACWVDAQGSPVGGVTAWAEMPRLPVLEVA